MKIALLHYSGPPVVGGVEQTLYYHAIHLLQRGLQPMLIVGEGKSFDANIPVKVLPELFSRHPRVLQVKRELDAGEVGPAFQSLQEDIERALLELLQGVEVLIVHNALTLHKNLALTAALWELLIADELPPLIGWHHDFAWDRPGYREELHEAIPWSLLRQPWPGVTNVVVSQAQRARLARLYKIDPARLTVIPPGIDPANLGRWSYLAQRLVEELGLNKADLIFLLPARITRRKNIQFALRILAELRAISNRDVRLIVTGPPGPHNPANAAYLEELLALREELDLEEHAHFLYQMGASPPQYIDDVTMANLYLICDALLFPSLDEGFGIPLLEAAYTRMPIFCSDIPPFREVGGADVHAFDLGAEPSQIARAIASRMLEDPVSRMRARARKQYSWENIIDQQVLPLLERVRDEQP